MKDFDLHPSEWKRKDKREPILGHNGLYFLIMIPVTIAIVYFAHWLVIDLLGFPPVR